MMSYDDELERSAHARVGARVGPYIVQSLIGLGGMAAVFCAVGPDAKRYAMKVLHREYSQHPEVRRRFVMEAYVANRIGHPAVVRVVDHGVDADGSAFLVMDLLEGCTLEALRRAHGGKLVPAQALGIAAQLLDVLAVAHVTGVVHRDVKPDNVFIERAGTLRLMDFGIARLLDGSGATRTGAILGTPAFMPPEQASGRAKQADPRSDVWSVGALLFMLLTNEEVHVAPNPTAQMVFAGTRPARSVLTAAPSLPRDIAHLVDRALAFDPTHRWPSAADMRAALGAAAAQAGLAAAPTRGVLELVTDPAYASTIHDWSGRGSAS